MYYLELFYHLRKTSIIPLLRPFFQSNPSIICVQSSRSCEWGVQWFFERQTCKSPSSATLRPRLNHSTPGSEENRKLVSNTSEKNWVTYYFETRFYAGHQRQISILIVLSILSDIYLYKSVMI